MEEPSEREEREEREERKEKRKKIGAPSKKKLIPDNTSLL